MNIPKVSIIVPVYKADKYIYRCVDSILAQTLSDIEILLIDDGSPDKSGIICDEYAHRDPRIKVFHKDNGGVSSARNVGIDNARGEWISFVDADDWIEPETIETCINAAEGYEMIRFGMKSIFTGHVIEDRRINEKWDYNEYLSNVVARQTIVGVWGGLYLRSVFIDNNIRFNSKFTLGEDWLVLFTYLKRISRLKIIDRPFYNYNKMNEMSATSTLCMQKYMQLNEVASEICYDPYLSYRVGYNAIASLKANICGYCIAALLTKSSSLSIYKSMLMDMRKQNIYPSWMEIYKSTLGIKFKIVLLCISLWAYLYPQSK